jgi:hypothetical protein
MRFDQAEFDVRCEWGEQGVLQLAPSVGNFNPRFQSALRLPTAKGRSPFRIGKIKAVRFW